MSLGSSAVSILHAVFALTVLTLVMAAWMSVARIVGMQRNGVALQEAAHTVDLRERLPSSIRQVADNYNHLFEAPTAFYAVAFGIILAGLADPLHGYCAWAFVALRVAHSLIQASFNRVNIRAITYTMSWVPLATMIIRAAVTI